MSESYSVIAKLQASGMEEFKQAFKQAEQSISDFNKRAQKAGDKMADYGRTMTLGLTVPLTAVGVASFKAAADFETGMAGVRKTTDMTANELEKMGQSLRNMAKEIPVSVNELTELAETAGQLGIEKDNIVDFTRVMADLGVASNIAGQDGATAMAQFANVTKMSQKDFDRMGSSIVELGNNSATTERDVLNMATRLAAAGSQAKMSQADILGISAALASLGLEAQAGGSAFSKVINEIQLAVDTNSKSLTDYAKVAGMSAAEFSKAWGEDAAGALATFVVGLGDTELHGRSTNEILDELGITELRMGDALRRTSGANELFVETLEMSNKAWEENNALTNEASILAETTESKLQLAKSELNDAAIELGTHLLPIVTDVIGVFTDLISKFSELSPEAQKNIIKFGLLAAAAGPVITLLGKTTKGVINLAEGFTTLAGKITRGESLLAGLSTAGTVGLAIAGIGALVGVIAVLASSYESTTTQVRDLIKATKESAEAHKEVKREVEGSLAQTKQLGERYLELASKTHLSNTEQEEMKWLSEDLVAIMPELNKHLDEETGLLKLGKDAWEEYFDAKNQFETEKANYERRNELAIEHDELQEKLAIARRERAEAEEKYGDSTAIEAARRLSQTKENVEDLTEAIATNREELVAAGGQTEESARRTEWALGMIEYAYGKSADAADDHSDAVVTGSNKIARLAGGNIEEYLKLLKQEKEAYKQYTEDVEKYSAENLRTMSGFFKEKLDLSTASAQDFIKRLDDENQAFSDYHADLLIVAQKVGPDIAQMLEDYGPDAAPMIKKLVEGTDGELEELAEVYKERQDLANKAAEEKAKEIDSFGIGKDYWQGVIDGMESQRSRLRWKVASMTAEIPEGTRRALEIQSPSKVGVAIGSNYTDSIGIGMESRRRALGDHARGLANEMATSTGEELKDLEADYHYDRQKRTREYNQSVARIKKRAREEERDLTKDELWELADMKRTHDRDMLDMEERYQGDRLAMIEQAGLDAVDAGERYVDKQKWLGQMSLSAEIYYWNQMYESLEKGSAAYEQALANHQSAVARLRSQMESVNEDYSKRIADIDKNLARETERLNETRARETTRIEDQRVRAIEAANKKLVDGTKRINDKVAKSAIQTQNTIASGTKRIQENLARDQENIQKKLVSDSDNVRKQLENGIERLNNAYESALNSRVSQLTNITGLFGRFQRKSAVPETALIRNLHSQVEALEEYSKTMEGIKDRVSNEELIAELEKLGPNSLAELEAINRMSDDQLAEFVELYEKRYALAAEQATKELAPLKSETEKQIKELNLVATRELNELEKIAKESFAAATRAARAELVQLEKEAAASFEAVSLNAAEELAALEAEHEETLKSVNETTEEELQKLNDETEESLKELNVIAEAELSELEQEWVDKIGSIVAGSEKQFDSMYQVGVDAVNGLRDGLLDSTANNALASAANSIASNVADVIANALGVKSPSRVTMMIGKELPVGMALGIDKEAFRAIKSALHLATDVSAALVPSLDVPISYDRGKIIPMSIARGDLQQGGSSGTTITQNLTFQAPDALAPSEIARQVKNASRQLAMGG